MNEQVKKHISAAYNHLRSMTVSHDNVKKVALAEQELESAFLAAEEVDKKLKDEALEHKEETPDGQND